MKHFSSLLILLATILAVYAFPRDIQKELDGLPPNEHVTITFYEQLDCKEGLYPHQKKSVVLTCPNDYSNTVDKYAIDAKAVNSSCVSGKFVSYKISNQFYSMEKLATIGVTKGQSQCSFKGNKAVKTYKPSVEDYVSGGCHNLGTKTPGDCNVPLGVHDDTTYTYQCTRGWAKVLDKRSKGNSHKVAAWGIEGTRSDDASDEGDLKKRGKSGKKSDAWVLELQKPACKKKDKAGNCQDVHHLLNPRSPEEVLTARFSGEKTPGWPIEGEGKPCKYRIGGVCQDHPPLSSQVRSSEEAEQKDADVLKRRDLKTPGWVLELKPKSCDRDSNGKCKGQAELLADQTTDCDSEETQQLEKRKKVPGWVIDGHQIPGDGSMFCDGLDWKLHKKRSVPDRG